MFRRGNLFDDIEWEFERMNQEFDRFFRQAHSMFQEGGAQRGRGTGGPGSPGRPVVYGYSLTMGPDGIPHVEHFGNLPGQQALQEGMREPFTSTQVDEEHDVVRVTAEMPGVHRKAIKLGATTDSLTIEAEGEDRKYAKTLRLPVAVKPDSAKARYHNGILDVTVALAEPVRPEARDVPIED